MTKQRKQLTVGQLIDRLQTASIDAEADATVRFDFCGCVPDGLMSYRGYYKDLAIGWKAPGYDVPDVKLAAFITEIVGMVGTNIEGYKGGIYTVTRDTAVWVANYGKSEGTYVHGIDASEPWCVRIKTRWAAL